MIEVLTRYLAKELGARRIAINTVAPGAIATISAAALFATIPSTATIPMRRFRSFGVLAE